MKIRSAIMYALIGAVLALGAPAGWLGWRLVLGALRGGILAELRDFSALYVYLLLGTSIAFVISGAIAGVLAERLQRANEQLRTVATTDALTSLKNRRYFHDWLEIECARADRAGSSLALVMADLDHFKRLNDRLGHAVGDQALQHAANILRSSVRVGDVPCRVGGEEFVIICPSCASEEAVQVAERVRHTLSSNSFTAAGGPEKVTASCGVALYRKGEGPQAFFQRVDAALYAAKHAGRNRVVVAEAPRLELCPSERAAAD